jgi:hypothetical protein
MRALSETVRGEALAGIPAGRRDALIDDLLNIKANLSDRDDGSDRAATRHQPDPEPRPRKTVRKQRVRQAHGT